MAVCHLLLRKVARGVVQCGLSFFEMQINLHQMECKEIRLVQGISSYLCNTKASGNQQATAEWMYMNNLKSF